MQDQVYAVMLKNKSLKSAEWGPLPSTLLRIIAEYVNEKERPFAKQLLWHFNPLSELKTTYINPGHFFSEIVCTGPKTKTHNYNLRNRTPGQKKGYNLSLRKMYAHHGGLYMDTIEGGDYRNNQDYMEKWETGVSFRVCNCKTLLCNSTC